MIFTRCDHPDYDLMKTVTDELDDAVALGASFKDIAGDINHHALTNMGMRRASQLGTSTDFVIRGTATWIDGFTAGVRFQQIRERGRHEGRGFLPTVRRIQSILRPVSDRNQVDQPAQR